MKTKFQKLIVSIVDALDEPFMIVDVRREVMKITGEADTIALDQRIRLNLNKIPKLKKEMIRHSAGEGYVYTKSETD